jgi:hypothetical protein
MYALVWEFGVSGKRDAAFQREYGPDGDWARLFRQGAGYFGSDLLVGEDEGGQRRCLTIDRWASRADYDAFHAAWQAEYHALDQACESLTEREMFIGPFTSIAL